MAKWKSKITVAHKGHYIKKINRIHPIQIKNVAEKKKKKNEKKKYKKKKKKVAANKKKFLQIKKVAANKVSYCK